MVILINFFYLLFILGFNEFNKVTSSVNFIVEILWIRKNQSVFHLLDQS